MLCRSRSKCLLQDARAYGGAETYTDHKIVCATINFGLTYLIGPKKNTSLRRLDCASLSSNMENKVNYMKNKTKAWNEINLSEVII